MSVFGYVGYQWKDLPPSYTPHGSYTQLGGCPPDLMLTYLPLCGGAETVLSPRAPSQAHSSNVAERRYEPSIGDESLLRDFT